MLYMVNLFVNILVELKKKKYQEKYFKYKQKYLNLSGGVINESLWEAYTSLSQFITNDFLAIKAKIFSSFTHTIDAPINFNAEFIKLSEPDRIHAIYILYKLYKINDKSLVNDYKYHICDSNVVIFYNIRLLNKFSPFDPIGIKRAPRD